PKPTVLLTPNLHLGTRFARRECCSRPLRGPVSSYHQTVPYPIRPPFLNLRVSEYKRFIFSSEKICGNLREPNGMRCLASGEPEGRTRRSSAICGKYPSKTVLHQQRPWFH